MMLHEGMTIRLQSGLYRVAFVNDCRAHLVPAERQVVMIGERVFEATGRGIDVSPASEVEIVAEAPDPDENRIERKH